MIAAVVLFAVVNLALVAVNGVRLGGDTPLYLDGASRLLDGRTLIDRQPSYVGYIVIVAAAQAIGAGTLGVVMLQVLLAAAAAGAVYAIGAAMAGRVAGGVAALCYCVDVDTNRWHQFILADSTYISLFVLAVWLTHRAATHRGIATAVSAFVALVAAAFVRPEGWFLLPAAIGYLIVVRARTTGQRVASAGALLVTATILVAILAPSFSGNVQAVGPANMLQRGQTIWEYDGWRVAMPPGETAGETQAGAAITYSLRHPISTITLMVARVAVHFAHVRPFYSTAHNVMIVLWLVPLYAVTVYGVWKLGFTPLVSWIVIAIATQTFVVALTHAEWDGRYLAHVLPLIDTLFGAGAALLFSRADVPSPVVAHA